MRKAFHWNAPQICFVAYVMLYVPNTDFFNRVRLSAIVRHVKCTFLDCFYTHLQLKSAISVLIYISLHIFCLHMFLTDSGWSYMAWQMMSLPPLGGISLIWSKNHFCSMYTSVSPQKHLFNIMNFVGIASHITCTFLSDYSINVHVYMLISVYILIFLHIFLSGNAWHRLWMQRYGMTDKPLHIWMKVTNDILVRWTPPSGSDSVWNWHLCQMFEYFYIFECILPNLDAQYHIYHTFTIVSYKCDICHLTSYAT